MDRLLRQRRQGEQHATSCRSHIVDCIKCSTGSTEPGLLTITGALETENAHCYRLAGRSGQTIHIELISVAAGFTIIGMGDNRYELEFKAKNQPYDIRLAHTFPHSKLDHYKLHIAFK